MIGVDNLEVFHSGTLILYDWDILGSSIYKVDILRIDDLRIDDQSLPNSLVFILAAGFKQSTLWRGFAQCCDFDRRYQLSAPC